MSDDICGSNPEAGQPSQAGPLSGDEIRGTCPVDLLPLERVSITSPTEVRTAVERAQRAQASWSRTSFEDRFKALEAAARAMLDKRGQAVDLVRLEMGKVDVDALFTEGLGPLDAVKSWGRIVRAALQPTKVRLNPLAFPQKKAWIELRPRGVVGAIAPWNFPIAGLYRSAFPALLTGNAWIVKPSEYTPRSSAWFVEQLARELPTDIAQVVQGGPHTGMALVNEVDAVVFTGSTQTGRRVAVQCAERGIPSSAELGGNDAAIVLADAHLPRTIAGLTQWALQNAGQACGAIEVAYVDHTIADALIPKLFDAWTRLRVGPGPTAEVDVAPLANAQQLARVEAQVEDARAKGGRILCGGRRTGAGYWFEPTLIDHCGDDMSVVQDETFGPVLAICRVEGPTEAIRRINRGRYGLTTSLWTEDIPRAQKLARRIDVGVVTLNNHGMTGAIPDLPWSGTRNSGFGIANSSWALSTFARPQTIFVDGSKSPEPYWLPFDAATWELGQALAEVQLRQLERAWKIPLLLRERAQRIKSFFQWESAQKDR